MVLNGKTLVAPRGFVSSLADTLEQIAADAREANPNHNGALKETSVLHITARYVRGAVRSRKAEAAPKCNFGGHDVDPAITDPRLYALYVAGGETAGYQPGPWQSHLLNRLGLEFGSYRDPAGVLTELATLALKDRGAQLKHAEDTLKAERAATEEQLAVIEPLRAELAEAQQHADDLAEQVALGRSAAADLAAQLAQERRITTVLRAADQPPAEPKRKATAKPAAKEPVNG